MEEKISIKPDGRLSDSKLPSVDPLKVHSGEHDEVPVEEIERKIRNIRNVLSEHKVKVADIQAVSGPSVTTFKVYPAPGVSCAKIKRLHDEMELSLNAGGVRVVTLSDAVGIEVANEHPSIVPLKSLLKDAAFRENKAALPIAIGRDAQGNPEIIDLAQAPHILMAGATKQGKTTAVHSLILSLLYSRTPDEVKFVFIDPKRCELKAYKGLNEEYIAALPDVEKKAIATTAEEAEKVLHSLCLEIEYRYCALARDNVNNIREYNAKVRNGKKMPYTIVVIDEYGDFLPFAGRDRKSRKVRSDIFSHIVDLAQKGRAVGMHLVITTQRPSKGVIFGIIKANFTTRMAFRVASEYDSYTIIDHPGAERLAGNGDMILAQGAEMIRIQGAYADAGDIDAVIRAIGSQQDDGKIHDTPYCLPSVEDAGAESSGSGGKTGLQNLDDMFEEAARMVVTTQIGSVAHLQLKLWIGYAKAGRLMDQLKAVGIVGPQEGAKPREVLVRTIDELEKKLKAYNDPESVKEKQYEEDYRNNRNLEERIDKWMEGISVRVKEMDEKCQKMMEALPELPENFDEMSQDEEEKVLEEECRRFSLWNRKGLSREEWSSFEREIQSKRAEFWKEYIMMRDSDYDCGYLLGILGFKLKWMVFYWDNFGHCENGGYRSAQMKLAVRLIDIIRAHGLDDTEAESLPYVNARNRDRFDGFRCDDGYYRKGEPQRVRFHKAWCLLWKLLKENLLDWWD